MYKLNSYDPLISNVYEILKWNMSPFLKSEMDRSRYLGNEFYKEILQREKINRIKIICHDFIILVICINALQKLEILKWMAYCIWVCTCLWAVNLGINLCLFYAPYLVSNSNKFIIHKLWVFKKHWSSQMLPLYFNSSIACGNHPSKLKWSYFL